MADQKSISPENFCYWLQGFFEITGGISNEGITLAQVNVIKKHLALVFTNVTSSEDKPALVKESPASQPPLSLEDLRKILQRQDKALQEDPRWGILRCGDGPRIC